MNRIFAMATDVAELSTEEVIVVETIEKVVENPGILRAYLDGLVPSLISFVLQVVLAFVIYAVSAS